MVGRSGCQALREQQGWAFAVDGRRKLVSAGRRRPEQLPVPFGRVCCPLAISSPHMNRPTHSQRETMAASAPRTNPKPVPRKGSHASTGAIRGYLLRSSDRLTSLILVLPLLILYNAGVAIQGWATLNGADAITDSVLRWTGREGWMALQLTLGIFFVAGIVVLRGKGKFQFRYMVPLTVEAALYGITMGSLILALMEEAHLLGPAGGPEGLIPILTVSAGAGVHEELLFRLGLIPLLTWGLQRGAELSINVALALAVLISSVLFSLAHYIGPESFALFSFVYRSLAGFVFAMLFLFRGFAVAVYTHFFYDVYVMTLD